jgi:hypothetical protein
VEKFFTEMISMFDGEEFWDTLRIMKLLCTDRDIIKSDAKPHTLRLGRDGVPACLLMFILQHQPPPDDTDKYYNMRLAAMDLLHEFWEAMLNVKSQGYAATFSNVTGRQQNRFVEAAMEFAKEYVKCTTDDMQGTKARLNHEIPGMYTLFEAPNASDEDRMNFLEAKAIYFGLYGFQLSVVELARLRAAARVV